MASLAITQNTLKVSLVSRQLEIERREERALAFSNCLKVKIVICILGGYMVSIYKEEVL